MKIAIAGFGVEGKSNLVYFSRPGNELTIVDENEALAGVPPGIPTRLGKGVFEQLADFDMVIRTASLDPRRIKTNGKIWSATNEFFAKCPAPIIGVTGSKGKGTTASLIAAILTAGGSKVHLLGNIGRPALDDLATIQSEDIVVYELSSYQLWDIEASPQVAVLVMIEPDHLDVHGTMENYLAAKSNIVAYQTADDEVIYYQANDYTRHIAERSRAHRQPYPDKTAVHIRDGVFWYGEQKLCSTDTVVLPGEHNLLNACAAITAAWPWVSDPIKIKQGLASFDGLPHRLKFIREIGGVRYYDDSIATTPGSVIAAVKAFQQPKVLILGGAPKGADYTELVRTLADSALRHVILIGREGPALAALLETSDVPHTLLGSGVTMDKIVKAAADKAETGDAVLLSPAAASFDMFKNYSDRGDQFSAAVHAL